LTHYPRLCAFIRYSLYSLFCVKILEKGWPILWTSPLGVWRKFA
jgi:hypothetical protein